MLQEDAGIGQPDSILFHLRQQDCMGHACELICMKSLGFTDRFGPFHISAFFTRPHTTLTHVELELCMSSQRQIQESMNILVKNVPNLSSLSLSIREPLVELDLSAAPRFPKLERFSLRTARFNILDIVDWEALISMLPITLKALTFSHVRFRRGELPRVLHTFGGLSEVAVNLCRVPSKVCG